MPGVLARRAQGFPPLRLPPPQLELVYTAAAAPRVDFTLSSEPASLAVLLRGKSAEGVQFCRSAGPAQGPRVVDGGGEIARLSELQRGKDHGDYAPASDVPTCEFDS